MTYLMRKITPLRWTQEQHDIHSNDDINAESLSDLCADENAISTWYVGEKTEENIIKAVTALASGFRSLDELSIVLIDDDMIKKAGLSISETEGFTKIKDYAHLHRDIDQLNAKQLVSLAGIILNSVWNGEIIAINAEELSMWLLKQVNEGKLKFLDLDKNFRVAFSGKIKKLINKKKIQLEDLDEELQRDLQEQWQLNQRGNIMCQNAGNCVNFLRAS